MPYINVGKVTEELNELEADKVSKGHEVIEFQAPTAENNYTWYRKYADGWVEQGGIQSTSSVTFPIEMANTNYFCFCLPIVYSSDGGSIDAQYNNKTTKTCQFLLRWQGGYTGINDNCQRCWEVKGMYAQ